MRDPYMRMLYVYIVQSMLSNGVFGSLGALLFMVFLECPLVVVVKNQESTRKQAEVSARIDSTIFSTPIYTYCITKDKSEQPLERASVPILKQG